MSKLDFKSIFTNALSDEAKALSGYSGDLSDLDSIIDLILNLEGKLVLIGIGKSGLIAQKIVSTLSSTGTPSIFLHPSEAMHGDLGVLSQKDCVLAISYSGESHEIIDILPHIKKKGLKVITMSKASRTQMSSLGDFFLPIDIRQEACPLNIAPTTSTTLTLAMGDALAICLMRARNFSKSDFALLHPGGSLGRTLYVKIADLMITQNLPLLHTDATLKEAIIIMTKSMLGNAFFVDSIKDFKDSKNSIRNTENFDPQDSKASCARLLGVLSDGDLRRAMFDKNFQLDSKAFQYATKSPKVLQTPETLAIDALKIMQDSKIQILPIVDRNHILQGAIHIHSLLQAGFK